MIGTDRPDLLYAALKQILRARGHSVPAPAVAGWDAATAGAWRVFCADFQLREPTGCPDYGSLPPLLRAWADAEAARVDADRAAHAVAAPPPPTTGPTMANLLPNADTGSPEGVLDAAGNFVPTKFDKGGNAVGMTAVDHHRLNKALHRVTAEPPGASSVSPAAAPQSAEEPRPAARAAPGGIRRPGPSTLRPGPSTATTVRVRPA